MSNTRLFLLCLTALIHLQCSKKMHPVNASNEITSPPVLPASSLSLKLNVSRAELNRSLDYLVNSSFSEGFTIEDGYRILTKISGPIDMQTSNNALVTRLPLQVDITPPGIFHNLKVKGQIEITLTTQIDIFQDQLLNKTELTQHKWISKPVVSVLGLNVPIEQIGNFAIRKYKAIICQSIDESISANIDLKKLKQVSQKYFSKPLYSTEDSIIHLFASPQEMALGPMSMTPEDLVLPLTIYFESVIAELRPVELNQDPGISIR
ncbi:MAG TPA: DUF4403 family protein, partial [Saprospiraceae bacterium]|nr:DUF4403 family protein [Saprospiraceae bacterium]